MFSKLTIQIIKGEFMRIMGGILAGALIILGLSDFIRNNFDGLDWIVLLAGFLTILLVIFVPARKVPNPNSSKEDV